MSRRAARLRCSFAAGLATVLGILGAAGGGRAIGAPAAPPSLPVEVSAQGAVAHLALDPDAFTGGTLPLTAWVERSMSIVGRYYGGFAVPMLRIVIIPTEGDRVSGGTTFGRPSALIRLRVGRAVGEPALLNDWVLVHEMVHLALPDVGEEHAWLSEGIATYVEGIARAQAGNRAVTDVWAEDVRSMPRGLPQPGDEGLDHTHTWGRTYWGGALFCLLADIEIRRRTANARGLEDALRAIAHQSGGLGSEWPIERVFAVGDAATGVPVLAGLYARMKDRPQPVDLPGLWRQLGIEPAGDSVRLHDDAPLASVRIAITRPDPSRDPR